MNNLVVVQKKEDRISKRKKKGNARRVLIVGITGCALL